MNGVTEPKSEKQMKLENDDRIKEEDTKKLSRKKWLNSNTPFLYPTQLILHCQIKTNYVDFLIIFVKFKIFQISEILKIIKFLKKFENNFQNF